MNLRAATPPRPAPVRQRATIPPKSVTGAVHVSGDGQVVEGDLGYYWYGDAIALATGGENGALWLLGGASVPHPAVVALAAVLAARQYGRERPGVLVVADEWAVRAWGAACHESELVQYAAGRLGEARAWQVYRAALDAARRAFLGL
jgi:hypothetical protein